MAKTVPEPLQTTIREAYRRLMESTGGKRRQGQKIIIGEVANAVANAKLAGTDANADGSRLLVVQSSTGSGKTFAYGLGALPVALAGGLRVVISTGTVQLQEQLFKRDLVRLQEVVPAMRVALVKGRGRWACPTRMAQAVDASPASETGITAARLLSELSSGTWSGDIDDLPSAPPQGVWGSFTNDRNGCSGRKCSQQAQCPYYRNRAEMAAANVLVVNHDLLFADVQSGNVLLGPPEEMALIVDEATSLPPKALKALANGHALGDAQQSVDRAGALMASIQRAARNGTCGRLAAQVMTALEIMGGTLSEARMAIANIDTDAAEHAAGRPLRFKRGKLPDWLGRVAMDCRSTAEAASRDIAALLAALQGEDGDNLPAKKREAFVSDVGRTAGRIERIVGVWKLMTELELGGIPVAKWIEVSADRQDMRVCASPVGVGQFLHDALWSRVACSVHLSATITTVGGFEPYLEESGLDRTPGVRTLEVESPFDVATQAALIVPKRVSNPKDVRAHTADLIRIIPESVEATGPACGSLILFTSWHQLKTVAEAMPTWIKDILLMQGTLSKRELLAHHTRAVEAGRASVIFATSSFEEGVDLPGRLCSLVLVAKLQFVQPTDPVAEALCEHMEGQGRSHFAEVVVPEACRRLAQSAGRLLRSETDTGNIIVADPRLTGTPYGRQMLAALPPYRLASGFPLAP